LQADQVRQARRLPARDRPGCVNDLEQFRAAMPVNVLDAAAAPADVAERDP
jgi:hypothetical protein